MTNMNSEIFECVKNVVKLSTPKVFEKEGVKFVAEYSATMNWCGAGYIGEMTDKHGTSVQFIGFDLLRF